MVITVGARVLMPESNHVTQLMNHYAKLITVFTNGNGLRPIASATHVGTAPVSQDYDQVFNNSVSIFKPTAQYI